LSQGVVAHMSLDVKETWIASIKRDQNGTIFDHRVIVGGVVVDLGKPTQNCGHLLS
jgi:hypothetical protein